MDERDLQEYHRLIEHGAVPYGFLYSTGGASYRSTDNTGEYIYVSPNDLAPQIPGTYASGQQVVTRTSVELPSSAYNSNEVIYNSFAGCDIVASMILPGEAPITIGELSTLSYSIHRENVPVRVIGRVGPRGFTKGPRTTAGSMIFTMFNEYAFYRLQRFNEARSAYGVHPLADMLPPFDIVITLSNEYGATSKMRILGVNIIDEGQTMSIEDLVTEQVYQYMARGITPMVKQQALVRRLISGEPTATNPRIP